MSLSSSALAARATSAFPVSVGTSLALESVFEGGGNSIDPDRQIPQKVLISDYQEFWVNIETLFRNLYSAVPSAESSVLVPGDCVDQLLQEMELIETLTHEQSNTLTKTVFYHCLNENYNNRPHVNRREYTTEKRKFYKQLSDKTCQQVIDRSREVRKMHLWRGALKPPKPTRSLIITHTPCDLLSYRKFEVLDLLESHTGLLRKPNTWHHKYYQGKELSMLPFTEKLLLVFGDNEMFHPMPIKARETIVALAREKRWTFATTEAKIDSDIGTLKDQLLAQVIKRM